MGLQSEQRRPPAEWLDTPPLRRPTAGVDLSWLKRGSWRLDPSATVQLLAVTVPAGRTLVIDFADIVGGDLFSIENLTVQFRRAGENVNAIRQVQRNLPPVSTFETFLQQLFLVENASDTDFDVEWRLTNGNAFGRIFGYFAIGGWLSNLLNVGGGT